LLLRQYGIGKPILVLGPIDTDITYAVNQNIEFVAYNKQIIEQLNSVGNKHNYIFGIHVKIDSGLSRIGIAPQKALTFIKYCNALPNIKVSGICTHLAEAQKENQCFTLQQISVFNTILKNMQKKHIKIPYKHVANTAATTIVPLNYCNFFRVGIGIYGLWPSEYVKKETQKKEPSFILKPCLAWKTRIIEVKKISAQSFVGYNRTHQVKRNSIVAILPVGYFDGYDMRFSDIACVRINDAYANIIGRVCMNHTIIDVTDIPNVNIGDEVILLGNDPKISAYYFATLTGNNNVREILTKIFPHIARIIIE